MAIDPEIIIQRSFEQCEVICVVTYKIMRKKYLNPIFACFRTVCNEQCMWNEWLAVQYCYSVHIINQFSCNSCSGMHATAVLVKNFMVIRNSAKTFPQHTCTECHQVVNRQLRTQRQQSLILFTEYLDHSFMQLYVYARHTAPHIIIIAY